MAPYPVHVGVPDIVPYQQGNTGIPYTFSFDSGVPGPHVMVNCLTHGNEICGAWVVKELLDLKLRPRKGKLSLAFANTAAFQSFDTQKPDASRFTEEDLNRVWNSDRLDSKDHSQELSRARDLRPLIDEVDYLLDIHSMHETCSPLLLSGPLDKGIELALQLKLPGDIIVDAGHKEGLRLRDYGEFGNPNSTKNSLLVECGQHWEASVVTAAKGITSNFLLGLGCIDQSDLSEDWWWHNQQPSRVIRVTDAVVAESDHFVFLEKYTGLEIIPVAGTQIGWNNGKPVITPYDNAVLVMPSLRQLRTGVTVVRFGKIDERV